VNGVLTGYGFDRGQLILEGQGSTITATYTWGIGLIRRNGEYPLADGLGTARQTSNGSGAVTATTVTEGFGQTVGGSGSTASPYGYNASSGYRSDGDGATYSAPLQKVGARYYDPEFGCFLTRDTELDESPYLYCDSDPINNVDPTGHIVTDQTLSHANLSMYMDSVIQGFGLVDQVADPTQNNSPTHPSGSSSPSQGSPDDQPAGGPVPITRGQALHLVGNLACGFIGLVGGLALGGPIGGAAGALAGYAIGEAIQRKLAGQSLKQMFHGL